MLHHIVSFFFAMRYIFFEGNDAKRRNKMDATFIIRR